MPERALTAAVKRLTGTVSPISPEAKERAKRHPRPEKAVRKNDLKKHLLLIEAVSIIIRETASAPAIRVL